MPDPTTAREAITAVLPAPGVAVSRDTILLNAGRAAPHLTRATLANRFTRMITAGEVVRVHRGTYTAPTPGPTPTETYTRALLAALDAVHDELPGAHGEYYIDCPPEHVADALHRAGWTPPEDTP